jgi:Electron transfer DM13
MEQLLAWLYPNRGLVALVAAVAVAVLALVGWRRGWHVTARRHPRAAAAVVIASLAVALPLGWYLGSPLFIRTALVEPAPVVVGGPTSSEAPEESIDASSPPASPSPEQHPAASPTTVPPSSPSQPPQSLQMFQGRFVGADDFHFARGRARLIETAPGSWVLRIEDFSVRNGPDLYVYLSPRAGGYARGAVEVGTLKATDGSFNYRLPAGTDVDAVRSVVIWCKAFSVEFGAARLNR